MCRAIRHPSFCTARSFWRPAGCILQIYTLTISVGRAKPAAWGVVQKPGAGMDARSPRSHASTSSRHEDGSCRGQVGGHHTTPHRCMVTRTVDGTARCMCEFPFFSFFCFVCHCMLHAWLCSHAWLQPPCRDTHSTAALASYGSVLGGYV